MTETFVIYCDESCHLENDREPVMVLGALVCPIEKVREVNRRLREIKERHGLSPFFETKWTKVSPARQDYFIEVVDFFFDHDDLRFRAIVCDKTALHHDRFSQSHDDWY